MLVGILFGLAESFAGPAGFPGGPLAGGLLDHLAGLVVGFLVSYPFYAAGGLKAGDGKLLMAVGALKGTAFLLQAAVWGALTGGIIAIVFIVLRRLSRPRARGSPQYDARPDEDLDPLRRGSWARRADRAGLPAPPHIMSVTDG